MRLALVLFASWLLLVACGAEASPEPPEEPGWPAVLHEEVALDIVSALERGDERIEVLSSPRERPLLPWAPIFDPSDRQLASDADRKVVRAAGGSAFVLDLANVPPGARLLARTLVYSPHRFEPEKADPWPVRFRIQAGDTTVAELASDYILEPRSHPFDQFLRTLEVDLSKWEGGPLRLSFEVLAGETPPPGAAIPETAWWELRLLQSVPLERQSSSKQRPNVLVLCIDTLAGGRTSLLGNPRPTTPQLDALARRGTSFTAAWSASSWTLPATASLFTGLPPNTHGVLGDDRSYLMESLFTFAEALRGEGLEGAAFVANPLIERFNNYHQGFSSWDTTDKIDDRQIEAPELYARFFAWLDTQPEGARWFSYVHSMDPHAPYGAPGAARDRFLEPGAQPEADLSGFLPRRLHESQQAPLSANDERYVTALYEAEVAYADAALGEFIAELERRGQLENTLVVLTADHGEELFEHGQLGHGYDLSEPMLRVPLLLFGPNVPAGRVVATPVSTASVAATLMAVGGVEPPSEIAPSLLPLGIGDQDVIFALTRTHLFGPQRLLASARDVAGRKVIVELDEQNRPVRVQAFDLSRSSTALIVLDALAESERASWDALVEKAAAWAADSAQARPADSASLVPSAQREQDAALKEVGYTGEEDR